jgi:hypothetical protein
MSRGRNRTPWRIPAHDAYRQGLRIFTALAAQKSGLGRAFNPAHAIIERDPEPVDKIPPLLQLLEVGPATQKMLQDLIGSACQSVSQIEISK